MSKLVLIDGYAILHRAYHALPPLTNKKGEIVNAIYGFVSMLLKTITDLKPTHIIVAFDREEKTFRREKFEGYQIKRKPVEDGLAKQFAMVRKLTSTLNIPSYELPGYESDDIIGTISKNAGIDKIVIITGDRDLFQLVNDKVKVYMPVKGFNEAKMYGEKEVKEKMGVAPSQIVDYKALVGDASDNYLGVPGVGPKTAISLIEKYGSFPEIYNHLDEISPGVVGKLQKGRESGELSYELAKIVTDCVIKFDLDEAAKWDIDNPKVIELFVNEFGFKTLTERVKKVGKELDEQKQMSLI